MPQRNPLLRFQQPAEPGTTLEGARSLPLELVDPNPWQVRQHFDPDAGATLQADIAAHGILQPLVVRPVGARWEIVAGERRYRAALALGLETVPVLIQAMDDATARAASIRENIHRADLDPEELGRYFLSLVASGAQQWEIAAAIGKSEMYVSRYLKLARDPALLERYEAGEVTLANLGAAPEPAAGDYVGTPDSNTVVRNENSTFTPPRRFGRQPAYRQLTTFATWAARADWQAIPTAERMTVIEHIEQLEATLADAKAALAAQEED